MAYVLEASVSATGTPNATTAAIDTTASNLIVLVTYDYFVGGSAARDIAVSDNQGNTYTDIGTTITGNGNGHRCKIWYVPGPTTSASHTFTVSSTGAFTSQPKIAALAFSGASGVPFNTSVANAAQAVTSKQAGSLTPDVGALVIAGLALENIGQTHAIDSSFTIAQEKDGASFGCVGAAYYVAPTTTALNPTWSWSGSACAATAHLATFAPGGTCNGGGAITVVADPTDGETFTGRTLNPRAWLEIGFGNSTVESTGYFALDAANHPATYYGGRKLGTLEQIGTITRQLSDRFSSYKMGDCTVDVDDTSRFFSRVESGESLFDVATSPATTTSGELWQNREGRIRLASPTTIAAAGTPHTLFRGIWRIHDSDGLKRTIGLTDILGSEFSDFNLEEQHPRRKVKDIFDNAAGIALEAATTDPVLLDAVKAANAKFKENRDKPQPIAYGQLSDKTATATTTPAITATFTDVYNALNTSYGAGTVETDWAFIIGVYDSRVLQGGGIPTTEQALVDVIGGGDYQMMLQYLSTSGGIVITDTGKGKIAPRYVGYYTCADAVVRHAWIVADSAIQHIEGRYLDGVSFNPNDHGYHDPETTDWATVSGTANDYMVIGGQTVTMLFIDQGAFADDIIGGSTELTLSICGREDVGDASGSTITAAPRIIFHLLNQSILQNYTTGTWAAAATSDDGVPWVNSQSFSDCEDVEINRIGGEGYVIAMYLDEAVTLRELLARLLTSTDIRLGQNKHGQIIGKHLDDFLDLSTAERFTDLHDLVAPTKFTRKLDELENHVDYDWNYRPADGSFETPDQSQFNTTAITANRGRVAKVDRREMFYVLDQATADDIASRGLSNAGGYVPRYATFTCTLHAISRVELGDVILVTDVDDQGADGDTDRPYWVLGIETFVGDLTSPPTVTLFCQDVERFFATSGRWGADTLNDYVSESAANQAAYLFWGNAAEEYSNGAPVKRWR